MDNVDCPQLLAAGAFANSCQNDMFAWRFLFAPVHKLFCSRALQFAGAFACQHSTQEITCKFCAAICGQCGQCGPWFFFGAKAIQ